MTESVLDFPKDSLCPDIWEKVLDVDGMNEVWQLKTDVRAQIYDVIQEVLKLTELGNAAAFDARITGSITSNSYTKNTDIDLHFVFKDGVGLELPTKQVQKKFSDAFAVLKRHNPDMTHVGTHPIEVYFQPNKFQDLMSVGCYDFFTHRWLVGPELADSSSFNPYSEYYREVQSHAKSLLYDIRNQVLDTYEKAVVFKKVADGEKRQQEADADIYDKTATDMQNSLQSAVVLYDNIRKTRQVYSSPTSAEQAMEFRSNRKWKIADATFKLLDKFGYLLILKQYKELNELMSSSPVNGIREDVAHSIITIAKDGIGNADKLAEKEKAKLDESIQHKKQIQALFEHWDPKYENLPQNEYGESWHLIDPQHWIYSTLDQIACDCQLDPEDKDPKVDRLCVQSVHEVNDENGDISHYIAVLFGGANGGGGDRKWITYLAVIKKAIARIKEKFADVWLIDLTNDCCDDLWTLRLGLQTKPEPETCPNLQPEPEADTPLEISNIECSKDEPIEEGVKGAMSVALLASMLSFPGIMPAEAAAKILKAAPSYQKANEELSKRSGSAGKYSEYHAADIIARTLYAEAQSDGYDGFMAVASVIYNRAKGKKNNFAIACLSPEQFSCWNAMTPEDKDPAKFKTKIPKNTIGHKENNCKWEQCKKIASDMILRKFKPTLKTANQYHVTDMKKPPSWSKQLKDVKYIGSHKFGYLKNHSDYLREGQTT